MQVSHRKFQEELLILGNRIDLENAPLILASVIFVKEIQVHRSTKPHVKCKLTPVCFSVFFVCWLGFFLNSN